MEMEERRRKGKRRKREEGEEPRGRIDTVIGDTARANARASEGECDRVFMWAVWHG